MSGETAAVLITLVFWGFVLGICTLPIYFRYRARRLVHETVRVLIAQGQPVPPDLVDALKGRREEGRGPIRGEQATTTGIIILGAGGGVAIFGVVLGCALWFNSLYKAATIAGPIIVGAGLLLGAIATAFLLVGVRTRGPADKD